MSAPKGTKILPDLVIREISDIFMRRNFEALREYFEKENQLLGFKYIEFETIRAVTNLKIAHGVGSVPKDLIPLMIVGDGQVTFNRMEFDSSMLDITTTGPVKVRMFAGNHRFGTLSPSESSPLEVWSADPVASADGTGGSSILTGVGAPADTLGEDGDFYIDTSNGNYYTKDDGEWELQGSFQGEQGDDGEYLVTDNSPIGEVKLWPHDSLPAGSDWQWCDGTAVSRTTYSDLFATIGTRYGIGDGTTTFNKPDYRGRFIRGNDDFGGSAASLDPDKASRTAMASGTHAITGTTSNGSSLITGISAAHYANVATGMTITGTNIPASSIVIAKSGGNQIQIGNTSGVSVNATGGATVSLTLSKSATAVFMGAVQADALQGHWHHIWRGLTNSGSNRDGYAASDSDNQDVAQSGKGPRTNLGAADLFSDGTNGTPRTSSESRPLNATIGFIIKVQSAVLPASGSGSIPDMLSRIDGLEDELEELDERLEFLESEQASASNLQSQTFSTPGTDSWTAPVGVTRVVVYGRGGAGGGGSGAVVGSTAGGGAGGGAGCVTASRTVEVTPGVSYTVVVGSGGAGGALNASGNGSSGAAGGTSSFGDAALGCTFLGGAGGGAGTTSSAGSGGTSITRSLGGSGGAGATGHNAGTAGQANCFAAGGSGGSAGGTVFASGGGGGGAGDGPGGDGGNGSTSGAIGANPSSGTLGGGGGGGGQSESIQAARGGNGSDGYITIVWGGIPS